MVNVTDILEGLLGTKILNNCPDPSDNFYTLHHERATYLSHGKRAIEFRTRRGLTFTLKDTSDLANIFSALNYRHLQA